MLNGLFSVVKLTCGLFASRYEWIRLMPGLY